MPIKRIEKQLDERGILGNMPRWGKLRKGGEKTEKSAGRDLNHFRLTLEPQYEFIRPAFEQICGKDPDVLHNVFIAADDAEQAFDYWYETWAHARLVARCDGETIVNGWSDGALAYDTTPRPCTCNPQDRTCKQHGRLDIVIPELCKIVGWGKLTVETTSIYDVIALRSYMRVAGAFLGQLPNVAFWSVPFAIGRAVRPVPVTINGKRSIKSMSLLFASIEPEFNAKVMSPQLTKSTQLLLEGVNPETGESPAGGLPEMEFEQAQNWDRDWVNAQTLHMFDHENHQTNAIDQMIAAGILTDDMNDIQVFTKIGQVRAERDAEKAQQAARKSASKTNKKGSNSGAAPEPVQSDLYWAKDAKTAHDLVQAAQDKLGLDHGQVLAALRVLAGNEEIEYVQGFYGERRIAWAACIALSIGYKPEAIGRVVADNENTKLLIEQINSVIQQRNDALARAASEIPF